MHSNVGLLHQLQATFSLFIYDRIHTNLRPKKLTTLECKADYVTLYRKINRTLQRPI